jgi:hypothetical protein
VGAAVPAVLAVVSLPLWEGSRVGVSRALSLRNHTPTLMDGPS